jgi:hypothetical protein
MVARFSTEMNAIFRSRNTLSNLQFDGKQTLLFTTHHSPLITARPMRPMAIEMQRRIEAK